MSGLWNRHGVDHGVKAARRLGRASIHRLRFIDLCFRT